VGVDNHRLSKENSAAININIQKTADVNEGLCTSKNWPTPGQGSGRNIPREDEAIAQVIIPPPRQFTQFDH